MKSKDPLPEKLVLPPKLTMLSNIRKIENTDLRTPKHHTIGNHLADEIHEADLQIIYEN